jgi:hypothetical protein
VSPDDAPHREADLDRLVEALAVVTGTKTG